MKKIASIEGMSCKHCAIRVEKALNNIEGVNAKVDLNSKSADISLKAEISDEIIKKAIEDVGYEVTGIK